MPATETPTADGRSGTVPWRSPTLVAVLAATLVTPMDVPLVSPALPAIGAAFGVSPPRAGLFVTGYALPGVLLAPVVGMLADRVGRRPVLVGCLALFGAAGTAVAFAETFAVALALRVLQGVAAGSVLSALAMTVVGDRYDGRRHDAAMGVTAAALSVATAVYPLVGGALAARAWNAPFLVYALALPAAGLVWVGLAGVDGHDARDSRDSHDGDARDPDRGYLRSALRAVPFGRVAVLYGVMFVSFSLLFGGIYTALPFHLADVYALSPTTVGLVTSGVLLVTAVVSTQNGRLSARASTTTLLALGFALFATGFLGVALAETLPVLVAALLPFGVGSGLVTPTLFAGLSALAPDHVRAGVMSLQTTTIGAGQAAGPACFTFLGGLVGYRPTFLGAAGVAAVCVAALAVLPLDP
ncbi:MFS transporter [Haloplanus rubicundus]|uniref:MFS transporter n=1 Tax=Haloplanus rubicundus TaxID=1547898 RepID=A0A345E920_9EURY|nr:MFS transporter [Haloplanus rubicundus]AXG08692.1 MFS transporter [Haloplanus rubicundus]